MASATIYIYDVIDPYYGVSAQYVAQRLEEIKGVDEIHLRILSPGGSVFEAVAMMSLLAARPERKKVFIDGLAASAAGFLAMAGDEILIADSAYIMVHNPWTVAAGNAIDLRKSADLLDEVGEKIVEVFVKKTGLDAETVREMLAEETWIDAASAVELGFAHSVMPTVQNRKSAMVNSQLLHDLSASLSKAPENIFEQFKLRRDESPAPKDEASEKPSPEQEKPGSLDPDYSVMEAELRLLQL